MTDQRKTFAKVEQARKPRNTLPEGLCLPAGSRGELSLKENALRLSGAAQGTRRPETANASGGENKGLSRHRLVLVFPKELLGMRAALEGRQGRQVRCSAPLGRCPGTTASSEERSSHGRRAEISQNLSLSPGRFAPRKGRGTPLHP